MRLRPYASWRRDIREIALIVVGVLIALTGNAWWQERQDRAAEHRILAEMRSTLAADLAALRDGERSLRETRTNVRRLLVVLRGRPVYSDSLDAYFGRAYSTGAFVMPNASVYQALKARGLDLVSDDSLRFAISNVYESGYAWLRWADDFNSTTTLQVLRPYFLAHFSDVRFGENARPLDSRAILSDAYLLNILAYREDTLGRSVLPIYRETIQADSALVARIDRRLGDDR